MNRCHCNERTFTSLINMRPRLFNWMTILLLTMWILVVAVVVERSRPNDSRVPDTQAFIEQLLR